MTRSRIFIGAGAALLLFSLTVSASSAARHSSESHIMFKGPGNYIRSNKQVGRSRPHVPANLPAHRRHKPNPAPHHGHHKRRHVYTTPSYGYVYGYPYVYYRRPNYYFYGYPYRPYYYSTYPHYYQPQPYRYGFYQYHYDYPSTPRYNDTQTEDTGAARRIEQAEQKAEQALQEALRARQAAEQLRADSYMEKIAEFFAAGDYEQAAKYASDALRDQPDSAILPFVYVQTLFAKGLYVDAAGVLRRALTDLDITDQGIFHPVGLYGDISVLEQQIEELTEFADDQQHRAGVHLLLGYQLMGLEQYDKAGDALTKAAEHYTDKDSAEILLKLIDQYRKLNEPSTETN